MYLMISIIEKESNHKSISIDADIGIALGSYTKVYDIRAGNISPIYKIAFIESYSTYKSNFHYLYGFM